MDITERLRLEAAPAAVPMTSERRHRYEFLAPLCAGRRVLELYCGDGTGSAVLAQRAQEVLGVDSDAASIDGAQVTVGRELENLRFRIADPLTVLDEEPPTRFEIVVCFDVPAHPVGLEQLIERVLSMDLGRTALAFSLDNAQIMPEAGSHGLSYERIRELTAGFSSAVTVPQYVAEGSLIRPPHASGQDVTLHSDDREDGPEYANHFIVLCGFAAEYLGAGDQGRMQLSVSPGFNHLVARMTEELRTLRAENARLGRRFLGKGGSAAASALHRLAHSDAEIAGLRHQLRLAEERVGELDAALVQLAATSQPGRPGLLPDEGAASQTIAPTRAVIEAVPARPISLAPGEDPNSWDQRNRRAAEVLIPWIEQTVSLAGKTVLEYGCGNAAVSCAFASRARRVIGVDIDAGWIELGRQSVRERAIENVELEQHSPDLILDAIARRRGQVDVFLLYAVLEHLTIEERLAVLRLAREVVNPNGAIVVCEAPNRLIYFDHHTAQMPFFHLLPERLALEYRSRSGRQDFKEALDTAAAQGTQQALETLCRLGRGVSFHEFEIAFGDLGAHVIASNYDPLLFGERPVHPDEVILSRYLARWRPDLAPVWSRYWLDLILSPQPLEKRPPFIRPWVADTVESKNVGWTAWENMRLKGPGSTLWVTPPQPTSRLVVGSVTQDGRWFVLQARPQGASESLTSGHMAPARVTAFSSFEFPEPTSRIALQASDECDVVFVGYED